MRSDLQRRVDASFRRAFGSEPAFTIRAPGRVNLIGEHTDYNGGFVLPCAIGAETRIAATLRDDHHVRIIAADFADEIDEIDISAVIEHSNEGGWREYARGMIAAMSGTDEILQGANLAIAGNIPKGTGLSSSASLEVAVGYALSRDPAPDPVRIALLAQAAENEFVGMRCGNMDQLASAASVAGAALLIDCRSLDLQPVPMPEGVTILIAHSGVARGLVEGRYNRRRASCERAAALLGIDLLRDATQRDLGRLSGEVLRRARHVVTENARVLAAAHALRDDDLQTLGTLMTESHASMRDDFEITVPAVDGLADIAHRAIGGEGGARMTGGGFGGAIVAVMRNDAVDRVRDAILSAYRTPEGGEPLIMIEEPAAGAGRVAA